MDLTALHAALNTKLLRAFPNVGNLQTLQLPPGVPVTTLLTAYRQSGLVQYAEPDYIVQLSLAPNDFRFADGSLWGLNNTGQLSGKPDADIDAPEGWDAQNTADNVIVAVIDSGARYTHEDLAANMWINPGESGKDFLGLDKSANGLDDDGDGYIDDVHGINAILGTGFPIDDNGHGSHVSGTIGGVGNNSVGVAGVCWRVQIMACKFADAVGQGSISDAITCIDYARNKGAKIINASWGSYSFNSTALRDAINSARSAGIIFVAAAGNDATDTDANPFYPAGYDLDNIIAVAATDRTDNRAGFSNFGASSVDLGAPGQDIFSCWNGSDSDYRFLSGTSMATPHVVGVCALTWARYPGETYRQIINRVLAGVDPLPALAGKTVTGGRLNLQKALGGSAPPPGLPTVTVTATDSSASESGPDPGTFTVTRTGGTTSALTVNYVLSGSAQNGSDYQTLPASVTIPAGAASAAVTVSPIDDSQVEGPETVILTLSANSAYTAGLPKSATITIADNDSLLPPLIVTPTTGLSSKGSPGGPFSSTSKTYALSNSTSMQLNWAATENGDWVNLSPAGGTLPPSATTNVTVSMNSQANQLSPGSYTTTVNFVNTSNGQGNTTRKVTLRVQKAATMSLISFQASVGTLLSAREFRFRVSGAPASTYVVEASSDLTKWTPVLTNFVSGAGYFDFVDSQIGQFPQRFYRTVYLPPTVSAESLLENFREDRILVKPRTGITQGVLAGLHQLLGVQVLQTYPGIGNLQVLQVPPTASVSDLIAVYRRSDLVEYVEPDFQVHALLAPDDFRYADGSLWGLNNVGQLGGVSDADIDAPEAWDVQSTAPNIIVAVIDTGVRYTHEDLAANMWVNPGETPGNGIDDDGDGFVDDVHGINTINNSGDPNDDHGHGTHVSGTLGAVGNNSVGVVGIAWNVQLMACKFLDPSGNGFISDAIRCIDYARSKGAKVINTSWGSATFNSTALHDAIESARQAGIILVAAAGNAADNDDVNPLYPASYDLDNIISVAATTRTDDLAFFSNYGATSVDLGAPGAAIFSCWNGSDSDYRYFDGTSMATPHVAGACALLMAHYPGENYQQIISRILSNVDPLPGLAGKCVSGGRLNLQKALGGSPPPPPPDRPAVTVAATDETAGEAGPDTGTFTISRTGDTASALTVKYALSGTAGNGTDYQSLSDSVTIPAGSSSAAVTVTPIDDSVAEGAETVVLTLSADPAYAVGSPNTATVNIADDDQPPPSGEPVITLEEFDPNASETGPDSGVIRFHRTGDTSQPIQVSWTFSGTAGNGTDFQQLPSTSVFPAGLTTADLTITPIDDSEVESDETVIVTLVAGPGYQVGSPNSATVTIHDNDQGPPPEKPTVTVAATDTNAAEAGSDTGTFTVSRTGNTDSALTIHFTLGGSSANGTDYQSLPTSVTIPAGAASAAITVTPVDDSEVEGAETVILTLSADAAYTVGSPSDATITIADNDSPPPPQLFTVTVRATDANSSESGDTGTFTVTREGNGSLAPLTVKYTLSGSAQNGTDYQSLSGSVTIPDSATSATVTVTPIDDSDVEGSETVVLTLSPNAAYTVGSPSSATVTIADNDQPPPPPPPTVTVVATDANAAEAGRDTGTFTLSRTGDTGSALTVKYTLGGSAIRCPVP
jgi:subtilisin family serine protease